MPSLDKPINMTNNIGIGASPKESLLLRSLTSPPTDKE
nr:MAG TPA: hypothetical protein [Caudoviricetes sp.]DAZ14367.1 MAG TPA: hypothetical protein [Caudoviricetes sp.]